MAWLEYGGRLRKLPDGVSVIGSGPDATFRIEDVDLMPRHVILHPRQDHVEVAAFSPDVVVTVSGAQIGTEPHPAPYGTPIRAGSAEFHVWVQQPAQDAGSDPTPVRAWLVDEREGAAYPLDRQATSIGRSSANVVKLMDPTASRFHAQIRREAGGFALHVVGSAGGAVNGRRISAPRLLSDGDIVELAYATFRFTTGTAPEGVRIIPVPPEGTAELSERPTMARERISLSQAGPGQPPDVLRTAVVLGIVTAVVVVAAALLFLL